MTIFDIISSILHTKKRLILDTESEKVFNLYMVCRWLSMYAPDKAIIINETVNRWSNIFDTKQEQYDFLFTLMNKSPFKRISYIKKPTQSEQKEEEDLSKQIAHNNYMSVRRYNELIQVHM